jgi:hypothetical protein
MGEERKVYSVLVGKPGGKEATRRPRRRWKDGIRMDLRAIGTGAWNGLNWLRIVTVGGLFCM